MGEEFFAYFFIFLVSPINGGGGGGPWALVPPYSYASDSGVARILLTGGGGGPQSEGAKLPSGGGCGRGLSLSHGREIFENVCIKTAFFGHYGVGFVMA